MYGNVPFLNVYKPIQYKIIQQKILHNHKGFTYIMYG